MSWIIHSNNNGGLVLGLENDVGLENDFWCGNMVHTVNCGDINDWISLGYRQWVAIVIYMLKLCTLKKGGIVGLV